MEQDETSKGLSLRDEDFLDSLERERIPGDQREKIREKIRELRNYKPKVGILGKTGAGKSSLCNAIFGQQVANVSDVEACTRTPQEIFISLSGEDKPGLILVDFPGIGESNERDQEYKNLYGKWLPKLDLILWVIKADDRALSVDETFYKKIIKSRKRIPPIVFVINQVDKIEPSVGGWDEQKNCPGPSQLSNLGKKAEVIGQRFELAPLHIPAVSASRGFGLVDLVSHIVTVLPKERKAAFVRETKAENVSPETAKEAEKGFWDSIGDWLSRMREKYKKEIEWAKEKAVDLAKKAIEEFIRKKYGS